MWPYDLAGTEGTRAVRRSCRGIPAQVRPDRRIHPVCRLAAESPIAESCRAGTRGDRCGPRGDTSRSRIFGLGRASQPVGRGQPILRYLRCIVCFVTPNKVPISAQLSPAWRPRRTATSSRRASCCRASRTAASSPTTPPSSSVATTVLTSSAYADAWDSAGAPAHGGGRSAAAADVCGRDESR